MKVCVVTVYNSINSGSYWQAKALEMFLENNNHEVYYYKRNNKGASASNKKIFERSLVLLFKLKFKELKNYLNTIKGFKKCKNNFKIIDKNDIGKMDLIILGSDTIWNIDTKYFLNNKETYFGGIFPKNNVISYAASIANTKLSTFEKYSEINGWLNNLDKIGVRDIYTKEVIEKLTNKNIDVVCDPTLLLSKEDYSLLANDVIDSNYIFIYLFNDLNEKQINELKEFAKSNSLKIISGTKNFSWCDKYIINSPHNFLNYMMHAKYIITDTFHGTVFSVNLNKNFVVINRNKNKVNEFLNKCTLGNRLVSKENIAKKLENNIKYLEVNKILNQYRNESIEFLNKKLYDIVE